MKIKIEQHHRSNNQTIDPEAYFVWNDIAKKLSVRQSISEEDSNLLRNAFIEFQSSEGEPFVPVLKRSIDEKVITTDQAYAIANHFFTERQLGTIEGKMVELHFTDMIMPSVQFREMLERVSIPEHTRRLIGNAYVAMKEFLKK